MSSPVLPSLHLAHTAAPVTPRDRILRIAGVESIVGLKKSTIYKLAQQSEFPAPIRIGARASGWSEAAVLQWVQDRIKEGGAK
jgi:prophage regulatory protein